MMNVEVITPCWLERLVARLQLENVGAVGPMRTTLTTQFSTLELRAAEVPADPRCDYKLWPATPQYRGTPAC